ncbi:hypothetical protein M3212_03890 [Alkalihalobacillus oceani]|uniref:alpha/beta hydrolase family protein n=1 Tax=Halalkalibacter oceani TaxID=1653776 RepID=UPI002042698C|nr:hypothetical protein [Halalkalibacter oceani]MCM3759927.1 hypothetical protein [Halalkalibacter oceani]
MSNQTTPVYSNKYGSVSLFACQYDQRFSYYAYIPKRDEGTTYSLAVIVHGDERAAQKFRGSFKDFAEETDTIILAPLFPSGIIEPDDTDNYKFIAFHDIRFDHVLLAMIDEIASKYTIAKDKFLLHGFSGGGQFVHRFYYLHPDKLLGLSIGAPGRLTYLDESKRWYAGIQDFEERFGQPIDLAQLTKVPVQLVVGSEDHGVAKPLSNAPATLDTSQIGDTRIERLKALRDNYQAHSIEVEYVEVPGVKHEPFKLLDPVKAFFKRVL